MRPSNVAWGAFMTFFHISNSSHLRTARHAKENIFGVLEFDSPKKIDQTSASLLIPPCFGPFGSTTTLFSNARACTCQETGQTVHKKCRKRIASCVILPGAVVLLLLLLAVHPDLHEIPSRAVAPSLPTRVDCENASESNQTFTKTAAVVWMHCIRLVHVRTRRNKTKQVHIQSVLGSVRQ